MVSPAAGSGPLSHNLAEAASPHRRRSVHNAARVYRRARSRSVTGKLFKLCE